MRRRLWVISELYAPEETSTGYVMTRLAEGLADEFDVRVLCGQPTYSARGTRAPGREWRNGVYVQRCAGTTMDKDFLPWRLLNLVTHSLSLALAAVRQIRRGDLVLVVTNPPLVPFLATIAARARDAVMILLVHDVYPDVMVATGMIGRGSVWERLGTAVNRWLYRSVERVIVVGRDMLRVALRKMPAKRADRVTVITNWADVDDVRPEPKTNNPLLHELGIQNAFVIQYAGNMGRPNDLDILVRAADRLRSDADVQFLFLGGGVRRAKLADDIRTRGLVHVHLLPARPRSEQQVFLNACDVAVVSLVPGMEGIGVPSRLYNILAAGRPAIVVTDPMSEPALTVRETGAGWVVPPGDVQRLLDVILEARANPARLADMGIRARRAAEERFGFQDVIAQYRRLMHDLPSTAVASSSGS